MKVFRLVLRGEAAMRALLLVFFLCSFSQLWAWEVDVERYMPSLAFSSSHREFPVHMTELAWAHGKKEVVEQNWEIYEPGSVSWPQTPSVSVYVTTDWDPFFACEDNPEGRFHVVEYHLYYARNDLAGSFGDHEHDWEWIYVVILDLPGYGHFPYAVSLSSHDDDNHGSDIYYFPWVESDRTIEVVDDTHPFIYVGPGNANGASGSADFVISWETLVQGLVMEDGSLFYTSCDGSDVIFNTTIAYGITGAEECTDPRETPWRRIHWDDPFELGQFANQLLGDPPLPPCSGPTVEDCCSGDCSWGDIRNCFYEPYQPFGARPLNDNRPVGVLTTSQGNRIFWPSWDRQATEFSLIRRSATFQEWDTVAVLADSSFLDPGAPGSVGYRVVAHREDGTRSRITPREARAMARALDSFESGVPLARLTRKGEDWVYAVSLDGFLHRLKISSAGEIVWKGRQDLRYWGLYEDQGDQPLDLATTRVTFYSDPDPSPGSGVQATARDRGSAPPQEWTLDLLLLAVPGRGTAVFSLDSSSGAAIFQSLGDPEAVDLEIRGRSVYAAGFDGVSAWELEDTPTTPVELVPKVPAYRPAGCTGGARSLVVGQAGRYYATFAMGEGIHDQFHVLRIQGGQWITTGWLEDCPPDIDVCDDLPVQWIAQAISPAGDRVGLMETGGHSTYTVVDVSDPSEPAWVSSWKNDLFRFIFAPWAFGGQTAFMLSDSLFVRAGATFVAYDSGCEDPPCLRRWGGLEAYEMAAVTGPESETYLTALCDEGFFGLEALDLVPTDMVMFRDGQSTRILVTYWDPLEDSDTSGRLILYDILEGGDVSAMPDEVPVPSASVGLGRAFPNPASGVTAWVLTLDRRVEVLAEVYDVGGRRVRRLANAPLGPGRIVIRWDGRNAAGAEVASGIYLLRVLAGQRPLVSRVLRLK
jgi:hypothetical protein